MIQNKDEVVDYQSLNSLQLLLRLLPKFVAQTAIRTANWRWNPGIINEYPYAGYSCLTFRHSVTP